MAREVVVVSGVRTPIGTFGGSLKDIAPTELAAQVVRESLKRASVDGAEVGHVVFGHVVNTEPKDMYLSRVAAINGGCAEGTPAYNVNRLCGSGLQAILSASQSILLGDCDIAIGGGAENMSRAPYASLNMRWGARMGDTKMVDMVVGALHDPFHTIHMGVTAENIAAKWGITREDQDRLAVESHNRAERAVQQGYFKSQILPILLAAYVMSVIEKWLRARVPNAIQLLVVPITTIVVTGVLALAVIGPVTRHLGILITEGVVTLFDLAPMVGGAIFGLLYAPLVITGMHHMFLAVDLQLISTQGGTFIWPMIVMSNLAQGSAALGVFYMTRNARDKSMASTSAISAYFGITEPAMFGVNLRFKFPFYAALLGSALGSIFLSLNKVTASAIGVGGLPAFISILPQYIPVFVIGMVIAMVVPFVLTCALSMKIVRPGYRVA